MGPASGRPAGRDVGQARALPAAELPELLPLGRGEWKQEQPGWALQMFTWGSCTAESVVSLLKPVLSETRGHPGYTSPTWLVPSSVTQLVLSSLPQARCQVTTARWCGASARIASTCTASSSGSTRSRCSSTAPCAARSGSSRSEAALPYSSLALRRPHPHSGSGRPGSPVGQSPLGCDRVETRTGAAFVFFHHNIDTFIQ